MRRREFTRLTFGAAATPVIFAPLAAMAQQRTLVIGYLHFASPHYEPSASADEVIE
jgi:hypothetical protein